MRIALEITMDGEAFTNHNGHEAGRILRDLAVDRLMPNALEVGDSFTMMDYNGKKVGRAVVFEN